MFLIVKWFILSRQWYIFIICLIILTLFMLKSTVDVSLIRTSYFKEDLYPKECFCGKENFCLHPMGSIYPKMQRKYFNCSYKKYLDDFHLLQKTNLLEVNQVELSPNLEFVTAASDNHFNLSRGFIDQIRRVHPTNKVIYYDLGLTNEQVEEVKTWCNVEYQKFNFDRYPPHVRDLMNYSWKVLLISEQFTKNRTFIYSDSSIRFNELYSLTKIFELVSGKRIEPYVALKNTYHSIYAATNPHFYDYVPLSKTITQNFRMDSAAIQLILPVDYTRIILKWKVLCALTPDCIAPKDHHLKCIFVGQDRFKLYRNCHRYDQSLLSALIARMLFGQQNWANKMRYTKKKMIETEMDIEKVLSKRKSRMFVVNKMISLMRYDSINSTLVSNCPIWMQ